MRRVLVVDDEENLRHMLQILLRREGYDAVGASSVDTALIEVERQPFDIIITDLRMPGRSGLDLVDESRGRKLGTTVVVMPACGSRGIAMETMEHGAYVSLSQPFVAVEVVVLRRKAGERERLFRERVFLRKQLRSGGKDAEVGLGEMVA